MNKWLVIVILVVVVVAVFVWISNQNDAELSPAKDGKKRTGVSDEGRQTDVLGRSVVVAPGDMVARVYGVEV